MMERRQIANESVAGAAAPKARSAPEDEHIGGYSRVTNRSSEREGRCKYIIPLRAANESRVSRAPICVAVPDATTEAARGLKGHVNQAPIASAPG
ncbi:hypothetical protein MRX96_035005 [Rhipicephalus microplus]